MRPEPVALYLTGVIRDNHSRLLQEMRPQFGAKAVFHCGNAILRHFELWQMETTKNQAIVQIIISDDEDDENIKPSNSIPPSNDELEKQSLQKRVISIVIPDEDLDQEVTCATVATEQLSSSTGDVPSPWKNLKFSEQNVKKLKAKITLKKLDLESCRKFKTGIRVEKTKYGRLVKPAASTSSDDRHLKLQVKVEKDDCQQPEPSVQKNVFESIGKKFPPVEKGTADMKNEPHNASYKKNHYSESTSGNKRLNSPPSSPSLIQSKLTEESFSPKKRPSALMYGCPRQEQPIPYGTPLYCSVPLRQSQHGAADPSKNFTETQLNSLQALKEENFHLSVLRTVSSFMSQRRKPPPSLVFYLLNNILLSKQTSCGKECSRILREIQILHPTVPAQVMAQKIPWEFISMLVERSKCTVNKFQSGDSSLEDNATSALSFLVTVMEDEVKLKTFSHVKTSSYRLLHMIKKANHIQDVISWIQTSMLQHDSKQPSHGCGHHVCPVNLFQRMLTLSLTVSERPEDCAARIADEMILAYCMMPSIELKTLFLQSTQSHLLRAKLIEVIVNNCCSLDHTELDNGRSRVGLKPIVCADFKRSPPGLDNGAKQCSSNSVDITASCEEFIMLLAYRLQSLVFCCKRSLQKNTSDSLRILSMEDEDVLREIDQSVGKLRKRLEDLCIPSTLSQRSYQLLDLMSSLKSFAPVITTP